MGETFSGGQAETIEEKPLAAEGVVLITGSNRGIGLALVKEFKKHTGWKVIASCRSPDKATDLNAVLGEKDLLVKMDIDDQKSVEESLKTVSEKFDHIDILVNNAGIASKNHPIDPVLKIDPEDFMKIFRVNVIGAWRVTTTYLDLVKKKNGKVIMLSSDLGSVENNRPNNKIGQPPGGKSSYRSTKAALNMLTRTFAVEVPELTFAAFSPGWVNTDMGGSGGRQPPLTPSESAKRLLRMCASVTKEDTGCFWTAKYESNWKIDF